MGKDQASFWHRPTKLHGFLIRLRVAVRRGLQQIYLADVSWVLIKKKSFSFLAKNAKKKLKISQPFLSFAKKLKTLLFWIVWGQCLHKKILLTVMICPFDRRL